MRIIALILAAFLIQAYAVQPLVCDESWTRADLEQTYV